MTNTILIIIALIIAVIIVLKLIGFVVKRIIPLTLIVMVIFYIISMTHGSQSLNAIITKGQAQIPQSVKQEAGSIFRKLNSWTPKPIVTFLQNSGSEVGKYINQTLAKL